jgi:hypothetical protein
MGTHNYGHTDVYVDASRDAAGNYTFSRVDINKPYRPRPGGGHGGVDLTITFTLNGTDDDLLYYTTNTRTLPRLVDVYARFGGDRHGDFYTGWVQELAADAALNIRIRDAVRERIASLEGSERVLGKLLAFCRSK